MRPDLLFWGPDFHDDVERRKQRMLQAYAQLPDAEALDEQVQEDLKKQFLPEIPSFRPQGEMWAEEGAAKIDVSRQHNNVGGFGNRPIMRDVPQYTVHVPFDGDADVFGVAPSMYNGTAYPGRIVGNELLLSYTMALPGFDLQKVIDNQIRQINSVLQYFRDQQIVLEQALNGALAQAVMVRKQQSQLRAGVAGTLKMPLRRASSAPASKPRETKPEQAAERWQVFISHASEDSSYVGQLHRTFVAVGIKVWVDKGVLRWGDRLRSRIDDGLKRSQFVIVVLSKAFLGVKKWTEYELDSAFALETVNRERILPLWHGITHADLLQYSPGLSARIALDTSKQSPTELANELLILLGRRPENAFPVAETVPVAEPPSHAAEDVRKGETVSYAWYWTRDGKLSGLYLRKSISQAGAFTLEEPGGTVSVGGKDEIAGKYISADMKLRRDGLKRSSVQGSSEYPEFSLP